MSWAQENGTDAISGAWGTFPREKMIAMDMQAQMQMLRVHEDLCNPHIKQAIIDNTMRARRCADERRRMADEAARLAEEEAARVVEERRLAIEAKEKAARLELSSHEIIRLALHSFPPLVRMADIISARRDRQIVRARQVAMWLCKRFTTKTYPQVGKVFRKDHSTVIHAFETVQHIVEVLELDGGEDPAAWAKLLASLTQEEWTAARRSQATSKMRRAA